MKGENGASILEQSAEYRKTIDPVGPQMTGAISNSQPAGFAVADLGVDLDWRLLRLLNLFRMFSAGLFITIYFSTTAPRPFGVHHPNLFIWTSIVFFSFGILSSFTIFSRQPRLTLQIYFQLTADMLAIILLTHASGGLSSGLGSLLFIPIAAGSFLLVPQMAILFAAIAALAVLGENFYLQLEGLGSTAGYSNGGILGAIFFAMTLVGTRLAQKVRESEALAIRRGVDLQNLSQLNDYIIQHLQTGVVVIDHEGTLRQMNTSAAHFLGIPELSTGRKAAKVSEQLANLITAWQKDPLESPASFNAANNKFVIIPTVARLGPSSRQGLLIFLEDSHIAGEQMQQMKLAALGRLTASIAHEIRNPIGAISHASQLLAEYELAGAEERRFMEIIDTNTNRVNQIIENILQLSKRDDAKPEELELKPWLEDFIRDFQDSNSLPHDSIITDYGSEDACVRMDPSHLHQVMWNLLENASKYAGLNAKGKLVRIESLASMDSGRVQLTVEDFGPGIDPEMSAHLFEPFYTGSRKGTGLGLFIARELCECNFATLTYTLGKKQGSCFNILFAHPDRWLT